MSMEMAVVTFDGTHHAEQQLTGEQVEQLNQAAVAS